MAAKIRKARPDDAGQVGSLMAQLGYKRPTGFYAAKISQLDLDHTRVFVAEVDNALIGLAALHAMPLLHDHGCVGRLIALVVADGHRRHGVGRALVQACLDFGTSRSCVRFEVTSGDFRGDAHAFYESLGFVRVSQRFVLDR